MNIKKLLVTLGAFFIGILVFGRVSADAASKQLVLKAESNSNPYTSQWIKVSSPIPAKDVKSIEYLSGKVKKASSKKWKYAITVYFYEDNDGAVDGQFDVYYNGTYSVRLTTKAGKKYVKTIKIKNILPASENSEKEAVIKKISGPDKNGNYTITADFLYPYNKTYDEVVGLKVGDTIDFLGKEATVTQFYTLNEDNEYVSIKAFDDSCCTIVCKPKNYKDFYPEAEYGNDPDSYKFGLINEGGIFVAYDDFEYGMDAYVTVDFAYKSDVKLKVNKNTKVQPAYYDRMKYYDGCEISMKEYLALKKDHDLYEEYGIYVYDGINFHIYLKYDKKAKKHTDVVDILAEIYTP